MARVQHIHWAASRLERAASAVGVSRPGARLTHAIAGAGAGGGDQPRGPAITTVGDHGPCSSIHPLVPLLHSSTHDPPHERHPRARVGGRVQRRGRPLVALEGSHILVHALALQEHVRHLGLHRGRGCAGGRGGAVRVGGCSWCRDGSRAAARAACRTAGLPRHVQMQPHGRASGAR